MKSTSLKSVFLSLSFALVSLTMSAQKNYILDNKTNFTVAGTSTLHDWTMASVAKNGTANLTVEGSKVTDINAIQIDLPVESIKSGKSGMDKIAYETLETKKFKTIKYVLKSATKVNETTWDLVGTFTIAGASKVLKTQVKATVINGIVNIKGAQNITFSEFGMKAPTALLGTVKTGQNLTLNFNLNYK